MEPQTLTPADVANELSETELLKLENTRLKTVVQAMESKDVELREIAEDCKKKELVRDQCKKALQKANEELTLSHEALAERASGEVVVKVDFSKKVGDGETCAEPVKDDAVDGKPKKKKKGAKSELSAGGDHAPVCGTFQAWTFAVDRAKLEACDVTNLTQLEPEVARRKVGAVRAMGDAFYVPIAQRCFEDESGYFDALPLVDAGEWDARLAETYGPAVFDLGEETKEDAGIRKLGGELCGVVVKVGRKKLVVGPESEKVRLTYGKEGRHTGEGCIAAQMLVAEKKGKA